MGTFDIAEISNCALRDEGCLGADPSLLDIAGTDTLTDATLQAQKEAAIKAGDCGIPLDEAQVRLPVLKHTDGVTTIETGEQRPLIAADASPHDRVVQLLRSLSICARHCDTCPVSDYI